ncbi:alpha/beta fold hydrolase [Bacillus sp. JJ722]|uniref:alpha/beta fold hydrolase n=1 Tax=Bacillus sp. JJ722 TaxID=3122973 RepID=UPI002FFD6DFC
MHFTYENRNIFYNVEGDGPVILFLHGLGGNANNWYYQRKYFASNWTVISLDLPGHGRSEGEDIHFKEYPNVVLTLINYLKLESVVICGLSKGARVGIDLASQYPDLVSALIIINAFAHLEPVDRKERIEVYDLLSLNDQGKTWADTLLKEMGVAENETIVRGFHHSVRSLNPAHIQRLFSELVDYDQRQYLSNIKCPVLLIRGINDHFVPESYMREFKQYLSYSTFVELENCGHLPYLEQPEQFNQIVEEFIDTVF